MLQGLRPQSTRLAGESVVADEIATIVSEIPDRAGYSWRIYRDAATDRALRRTGAPQILHTKTVLRTTQYNAGLCRCAESERASIHGHRHIAKCDSENVAPFVSTG